MSKEENDYIRLNQDFYLDSSNIGNLISVIVDVDYYNTKEYKNCLLVNLFFKNNLRPNKMTVLYNGKLENISINKLSNIQIKFIN